MILSDNQIKKRIKEGELVENYVDLGTQVSPGGFDVTVKKVYSFKTRGRVDFSNSERKLPETKIIKWEKENPGDEYGWIHLEPGCYKLRTNEKIILDKNTLGIMRPRSTLLRCGATVDTGVIDPGFEGKMEFLLMVQNPEGFSLKENARIVQIVFMKMYEESEKGYEGRYKNLE